MAHPDDEIIFGWPIFQDRSMDRELLLCSSDANNPERAWCSHRKNVTQDICDELGIKLTVLDHPSEFYRHETRKETMSKVLDDMYNTIEGCEYDSIFTHNPYGEYGHLDHKMLFDLVLRKTTKDVYFTDINLKSNWPSMDKESEKYRSVYYTDKVGEYELDENLYAWCEKKYRQANVWTWNKPPVRKCGLYRL